MVDRETKEGLYPHERQICVKSRILLQKLSEQRPGQDSCFNRYAAPPNDLAEHFPPSTRLTKPIEAHPSMSEGKSAGFFPSVVRDLYAAWFGQGTGLGGRGHGSVPSATSTPVLLTPQAAASQFGCFDPRACTTLGKAATAANKTTVTRVPRTLSFDIFISLKE